MCLVRVELGLGVGLGSGLGLGLGVGLECGQGMPADGGGEVRPAAAEERAEDTVVDGPLTGAYGGGLCRADGVVTLVRRGGVRVGVGV